MSKKFANIIIIGGTIAAGKSTLVEGLAKRKGFEPVPELREGDIVQDIILRKLYEGTRIHQATIQYYFIANRYRQYKEHSGGLVTSILDRAIWEDWFFALLLMKDEKREYQHYIRLWKSTLSKIIELYGAPKTYIYVKVDWESFRKRIFLRGREAEIKNFSANENYFKELLKQYINNFEKLLAEWEIDTITIDTTKMNKEEVLEYALKELGKRGI